MKTHESNNHPERAVTFTPIGSIHSPFKTLTDVPIQPVRSAALGNVQLDPQFADALKDIEGFSHLHLIYVFHHAAEYQPHVQPYLDNQAHGLFATRFPNRPNPIGLSIVELVSRADNVLVVKGIDVLDGTPLLDIKPYIPAFDIRENARAGWFENRSKA